MSLRYKGGRISATPPTTTGGESGVASGAWTLEQQLQAQGAGNWPLPPQPKYIEDVFSTYLYTGNGATRTITNDIDLSTKGGLIWLKNRSVAGSNLLFDTARGADNLLQTDQTGSQSNSVGYMTTFNTTGFGLAGSVVSNASSQTYASWTFRKQPKFFDVVTYTGTGSLQNVAHSLGSAPGCVIVKRTDAGGTNWMVYHVGIPSGASGFLRLNTTAAYANAASLWNDTAPTSSVFTVNTDSSVNASGGTYVAYVFAHDAGGFGLTGTDNVISCGSFTTDGSGNATVDLGYETQWVTVKRSDSTSSWFMMDNMRGMSVNGTGSLLLANASDAESGNPRVYPTATGFAAVPGVLAASATYIYIAIRRGPMKVPTDGTKVFNTVTATGGPPVFTSGFVTDMSWTRVKNVTATGFRWVSRLLNGTYTDSSTTAAESALAQYSFDYQNGWRNATVTDSTLLSWSFQRAPGFFDEVCYTGTGANLSVSHNLGAIPQLWIVKGRNGATDWMVGSSLLANTEYLFLNANAAKQTAGGSSMWNSTYPTASTLYLGTASPVNNSASDTYVSYLFATCPGVSKVGSYTGTNATQTIACGFTGGARFVLIKRTDSTGDWYVWDTARGMVSGTDPSLLLNSTAAEVNANSIYTATTGFQIVSTAAGINASGGNYIFLAIA